MALKNYDYTSELSKMKEAQKQAAIADLDKAKNQTLSDLNAEETKNTANYNSQRSTANAQNRLSARNFQEYLANTGRANSGLGAQARMQYNNNLNTSLNSITGAENAARADINRRRTDADNVYSSGLASANANIESNYIQNLLNERQKQFEREQAILNQQLQERQFQENIRQFNENLALQKQQLQSRFSSGSGGGRRSSRGSSSKSSDIGFTDTSSENEDMELLSQAIANSIALKSQEALNALKSKKSKSSGGKGAFGSVSGGGTR